MKSPRPQRSVLRHLLFNLFMCDLEVGMSSAGAKFTNDTELFKKAKTKRDCEEL